MTFALWWGLAKKAVRRPWWGCVGVEIWIVGCRICKQLRAVGIPLVDLTRVSVKQGTVRYKQRCFIGSTLQYTYLPDPSLFIVHGGEMDSTREKGCLDQRWVDFGWARKANFFFFKCAGLRQKKKKKKKKDNDRVANSPLYLNIFSYQDSEQI